MDSWTNNLTQNHEPKAPLQPKITPIKENIPVKSAPQISSILISKPPLPTAVKNRNIFENTPSPTNVSSNANPSNQVVGGTNVNVNAKPINTAGSTIASNNLANRPNTHRGGPSIRSQSLGADPFDADWATPHARTGQTPTNPFARQQTFQISM